jgi:branched-chain amino acid transport system ATP-binding protein
MILLQVDRLSKRFGGLQAVSDVSFQIEQGEILGLFGPNGAGKTTTFNLIAGNLFPNSGSVHLDGQDLTRLPAARRARLGVGRTFQVVRPFRDLTVIDNLMAAVPSEAAPGPGTTDQALTLLRQVGLEDRAGLRAGILTLGMLKRLEVARALMTSPRLLLLDEPLAGLSEREAIEILALVVELKTSAAIIIVEHNVRLCLPVCDNALVMDAGSVLARGTPDEIRRNPAVIRAYLGKEAE